MKMAEMMERDKRRNNLVFMGIMEDDKEREKVAKIVELLVQEVEVKYKIIGRVGREGTTGVEGKKIRPLRICVEDVGHRRLLLSRGKNLKSTEYNKVYIVPDLTRLQQGEDKQLRDKLKEIRESGKANARIIRGEIAAEEEGIRMVLFTQKK